MNFVKLLDFCSDPHGCQKFTLQFFKGLKIKSIDFLFEELQLMQSTYFLKLTANLDCLHQLNLGL